MVRAKILKALDAVHRLLVAVGAVAVVVMMLNIVANALMRSLANAPLTSTNEYVTYWYMPLVALLGFVVAQRHRAHTEASVLFDRLPPANRRELRIAGLLITAVVCAGFAYYGWLEAAHSFRIGLTGGVTGVTIWPMVFLVPITYTVLTAQVLTESVRAALTPGSSDQTPQEAPDARG